MGVMAWCGGGLRASYQLAALPRGHIAVHKIATWSIVVPHSSFVVLSQESYAGRTRTAGKHLRQMSLALRRLAASTGGRGAGGMGCALQCRVLRVPAASCQHCCSWHCHIVATCSAALFVYVAQPAPWVRACNRCAWCPGATGSKQQFS
jgi:hypothetical protein